MKIPKIIKLLMLSATLFVACKKEETSTSTPAPSPTQSSASPSTLNASPADNSTGAARNTSIEVTFSAAMDPLSITSSTMLVTEGTNSIPGIVSYSGVTATFTPAIAFSALTKYTAKITTGAKSLYGKPLLTAKEWSFTTGGTAATTLLAPVNLGASVNYVILAKTAINNSPTSKITGDLGLSPAATSYITGLSVTNATGYATSSQVTGKIYAADMATPTPINLTTSVNNMVTAYNDAAGRPSPDFVELGAGNIGGKTLAKGLYKWAGNVTLPSSVTISGGPNDVWIFQIAGNLNASSAVNITLSGGAQAKNIFWQVAGAVTIGTTAHFEGVILSMTGITLRTGASVNGRLLAQSAVILDSNVVTQP